MFYISEMASPIGELVLGASETGLLYVGRKHDAAQEIARFFGSVEVQADAVILAPYQQQLSAYFAGERSTFSLPLDLRGTDFQQQVWQALQAIPYGETVAYSELAEQLGRSKAVRAVANAVGRNPILVIIPCHRVIGKNGKITGFRAGTQVKEQLLQGESCGNFK